MDKRTWWCVLCVAEKVPDPAGTRWTYHPLSDSHRKVVKHLRSFYGLSDNDLSSARQVDSHTTGVLFIPPSKQLAMWQRSAIVRSDMGRRGDWESDTHR